MLAVATLLTLLMGTGRVYLGVHWRSDVLAGWAIGFAWAFMASLVMALLQRKRSGGMC